MDYLTLSSEELPSKFLKQTKAIFVLIDSIFETGKYGVPSKSQNPTISNQGVPSST